MIELAEIDLYERGLQLQVLAQAAKRHPGSSLWIAGHRAQTLSRGHDPSRGHFFEPTLGVTDPHSLSGHALAESSIPLSSPHLTKTRLTDPFGEVAKGVCPNDRYRCSL